uniref:Uncharacterized protein n=1 Tax=uncultured Planctomycetota bacterium TaxID=120965 RepID=H5SJQ8_9BACT|nr:hypothetical protein HGMM_F37F03C17 [uncultured Planctomycetota bacterium]
MFVLGVDLLGRTVQCGHCRNYFVVVPAPEADQYAQSAEAARRLATIQVQGVIHFVRRAWLRDWQGEKWYVRYPSNWLEVSHFLFALALFGAAILGTIATVIFLVQAIGAPNGPGLFGLVFLTLALGCAVLPLYLWVKLSMPRFVTGIYAGQKRPPYFSQRTLWRPVIFIRAPSVWRMLLGRWQIEDHRGEILAELRRTIWPWRLFTRRRWTMRIPNWESQFLIEETFWLPGAVRWLLLLPLGLLRLAFFLTPWLLRPFRPNCRVRLAGTSYVLAQSRTVVSLVDTTVLELNTGAEQLLDWRLVRALAALLHGEA